MTTFALGPYSFRAAPYGPLGSLQRAMLYDSTGTPVIGLPLTETVIGGDSTFPGSVALTTPPADSLTPWRYEVRQVTTQSDAAFNASTTVTVPMATYGYPLGGVWYETAAGLQALMQTTTLLGRNNPLSPQQTADASKLAPTAGTPAAGSVLDRLDVKVGSRAIPTDLQFTVNPTPVTGGFTADDRVVLNTRAAAGVNIITSSPVDPADEDSRLTLTQGDAHDTGDAVPTWTVTGYSGLALATTGKLRLLSAAAYRKLGDNAPADLQVDANVTTVGSTLTITAPVTAAQSAALTTTFPPGNQTTHYYQLIGMTSIGTKPRTLKLGPATVNRRIDSSL